MDGDMDTLEKIAFQAIGKPLPRKEDFRLVTGQGRYADDFYMAGQVYTAMVRSPYPHARVLGINATRARAMPGVFAIFTGTDCRNDGLAPILHDPVPATKYDMKLTAPRGGEIFAGRHELLPVDKVRYVGEAVAIAIAATRDQALDAAEAVEVAYEELPVVVDSDAALAPRAPALWDEVPDNVLVDTLFGDAQATERAFATADHVVSMDFKVTRASPMPMEPRAGLAQYDERTSRYTLYFTSGGPGVVRQRLQFAAVLGIAPERLRLVAYDIGGSFGARNRPYVEFGLILWAARKIGRPVKYTATRSEEMITGYQGRDLQTTVELALQSDGRFLAMRASNVSNVGAYCVSLSPLAKGGALITGSYHIPAATLRARAIFTNTVPTNTMRSSGRPEVNFAIERLIDTAAKQLGLDRIELRRKNIIRPEAMPYTNPVGTIYDSGRYEDAMDLAMRISDWPGATARQRAAAARRRCLGLGLANYVESSTGAPKERTAITITPEGRVKVVIGTQPSGQGHETSFSQVVSDLLAVPVEAIDIVMGDTDVVSEGGGSHSGRSMRHAATVMSMAAADLIANGKRIAAIIFDTTPDQIEFKERRFGAARSNRTLDFLELAKESARYVLPEDLKHGLAVVKDNEMHVPVFPNGCAVCEVEVDPDTGRVEITRYTSVDDVGRCINPLIVHGQSHGSIAHGVGEAMSERFYNDPDSGQPMIGSFQDYGIPRADDLPNLRTEIMEVLSPTNPLGIKSAGEGPTTAALGAVINAIVDALQTFNVRNIELPATPLAVWQAIQDAKAQDPATEAA
jgi:aerobic carbon-monoxide dehydrogenase large subunit